jgi:hypothetical protein
MAAIIQQNITAIKQLITTYEQQYQRPAGSVQLLAVSKGQPIEKIIAAVQAGQVAFGENYLQEALIKIAALSHLPAIEWHFIGPMQSNKTRKIAEQFAWVQSVDSMKIAKRLHEQRPLALPALNICLQVNISAEVSKGGVMAADVLPLAAYCRSLSRLKLRGLMTIPAPSTNFTAGREQFYQLYLIWQQLKQNGYALDTLSMGMSDDFAAAIAAGSTLVRIGTAIFGERVKSK